MAELITSKKTEQLTQPSRTITVKQLLIVLVSLLTITVAYLGYVYWQNQVVSKSSAVLNLTMQPQYQFTIYGNEQKKLQGPMAVYVSKTGKIYVSSTNAHEVQVFKPNGQYEFTIGKFGGKPGEFVYPYGICENSAGNILISETGNQRIQEFTPQGQFVRYVALPDGAINVEKPGPLVYAGGKLYIADLVKQQVLIIGTDEKVSQTLRNVSYPHGIAAGQNNQILVADSGGYRIVAFDQQGKELHSITGWQGQMQFSLLRGIAVDQIGRIYAVDSIASAVRVFDPAGKYLFSFGTQGFEKENLLYPTGIFIDNNTNRIFIADWANNRVSVWGY